MMRDEAVAVAPAAEPLGSARGSLLWARLWRRPSALLGAAVLLLLVLLAVCAPLVTPENPYDQMTWDATNQSLSPRLSPAWYFVLGTDTSGHLVLSQIAWGARLSLAAALLGSAGALLVGAILGAVAGYAGDWVDTLVMRTADAFLALPFLPVVLFAVKLFGGQDAWAMGRILAVFAWPGIARLTRVAYQELRQRQFAEAARALGLGHARIVVRHLLPNALGPIVVAGALTTAACLTAQTAVDYLRLGTQYPDVSWGTILIAAQGALGTDNWWWPVFPGLAIVLAVLSVHLLGVGLDDALDAR